MNCCLFGTILVKINMVIGLLLFAVGSLGYAG